MILNDDAPDFFFSQLIDHIKIHAFIQHSKFLLKKFKNSTFKSSHKLVSDFHEIHLEISKQKNC